MRKKYLIFSILLSVLILLSLCSKKQASYPLAQDLENIVKIEIVYIHNDRIFTSNSFDMIKTLATIDPAEHDAFLAEFQSLPCYKTGPSQEFTVGRAIRFTYSDSAFELVFDSTGFYCSAKRDWSYPPYRFDFDEFHLFIRNLLKD